jgi:glycosyltransferase involved in cell wall biosynthesis
MSDFSLPKLVYKIRKVFINQLKALVPRSLWATLRSKSGLRFSTQEHRRLFMNEWIAQRKAGRQPGNPTALRAGVNLVGFIRAATGLGEAARSSLRILDMAGIPTSLVDLQYDVPKRQLKPSIYQDKFSQEFPYTLNLLHLNPNHLPYLWETFGQQKLLGRYTIGVWYWELAEIPDEWVEAFQVIDEMWAPTEFIRAALAAKATIPVHLVPPCIEVQYDAHLTRADFGLPEKRFLFLCAYDVLSVPARKNPRGAVEAFQHAFSQDDHSVGLVIKINNAEEYPEGVAELERLLAGWDNCYFIKEVLEKEQFNALINNIDCYISLHRSEGFGLVAAEAMYLSKAVIMTAWSGNADFTRADNCCPIGYQLIPVGQGSEPYDPNQQWADPNLSEAAQAMRALKTDNAFYTAIAQKARQTILEMYSPQVVEKLVTQRLAAIHSL